MLYLILTGNRDVNVGYQINVIWVTATCVVVIEVHDLYSIVYLLIYNHAIVCKTYYIFLHI